MVSKSTNVITACGSNYKQDQQQATKVPVTTAEQTSYSNSILWFDEKAKILNRLVKEQNGPEPEPLHSIFIARLKKCMVKQATTATF